MGSVATTTRRRALGRKPALAPTPTPAEQRATADPLTKLLTAAEAGATGAAKTWLRMLLAGDAAEVATAET